MTPKNNADPEDDSLGVLDDTTSSDTSALGLLGGTAQVNVSLPTGGEDDDLADGEVVDGEIVSDLVIDTSAVADPDTLARIQRDAPEIVIELPADALPPVAPVEPAAEAAEAELIPDAGEPVSPQQDDTGAVVDADVVGAPAEELRTDAVAQPPAAAVTQKAEVAGDPADEPATAAATTATAKGETARKAPARKKSPARKGTSAAAKTASDRPTPDEPQHPKRERAVSAATKAEHPVAAVSKIDPARGNDESAPRSAEPATRTADAAASDDASAISAQPTADLQSALAAAKAELREAMSPNRPKTQPETRPRAAESAEESHTVATNDDAPAARPATEITRHVEAPRTAPEVVLTSKRLDDLGDAGRESADLLTADRLLDPSRVAKPEPEGAWSHLLYAISGGRINVGDGRKARARKELSARIAAPMTGSARFIPVLSRKGGVGKTTVTALLGMALADARDDRVIAVDANPDRGTLAERVVGGHTKSVRDLVRAQHDIRGFHDISALVARDETRLDVLASDSDPRVSEAFGDADYREVASVAAQYYSLVLTDSGTGIVHSVMGATLDLADQLVIVSGLSVDEARLASETITWLETNGHAALAREAIVVLNQSTPGTPLVRLGELESHFSTRVAHVLRIPYDPQIAGGGAIDFGSLLPETRRAAREVAATLVEGLRAKVA